MGRPAKRTEAAKVQRSWGEKRRRSLGLPAEASWDLRGSTWHCRLLSPSPHWVRSLHPSVSGGQCEAYKWHGLALFPVV